MSVDPTLRTSTGDFRMPTSQPQQTKNDFVSAFTSSQQEQAPQDGLLGTQLSQVSMPTQQQVGGGDGQLPGMSYPRTLFIPTDDALIAQLGQRLVDCLTLAVRGPLNNLLLFNLAEGVEYTSSLSHRTYLYTMLLSYTNVYAFPNGTILLGTNTVQITQPNIPASNGVIHIVNGLAIPPSFNFGKCQQLVPTTSPPTPAKPISSTTASSSTSGSG
ncbi:hypothetical protein EMCRGX_G033275 [Ephydatia muelleri]